MHEPKIRRTQRNQNIWTVAQAGSNDENIGGRIARWTFPLSTVEASDLILLLCSGQMLVCPSHNGCGGANRDHHGGGVCHQLQGDLHLADAGANRDHHGGGVCHQLQGDLHLADAGANRDHHGGGISHQLQGDFHLAGIGTNRDHHGEGVTHQLQGDFYLAGTGTNRDHHDGGVTHQLQGDLSGDDTSLRDNLGGPLEVPWVNEQQ